MALPGSDRRLNSLAFIIPFLDPSFLFCLLFFLYPFYPARQRFRSAPTFGRQWSSPLNCLLACFRVQYAYASLFVTLALALIFLLRLCTIASAPVSSVASLILERRFFHGYPRSRLKPHAGLQLPLPERSGWPPQILMYMLPNLPFLTLLLFYSIAI